MRNPVNSPFPNADEPQSPCALSGSFVIIGLFSVTPETAGRWHFSRRRLLSITDFGSSFPARQRTLGGAVTTKSYDSRALVCGGMPCSLSPRRGGRFIRFVI